MTETQVNKNNLGLTCEQVLACTNQRPEIDIFHPDLIESCRNRSAPDGKKGPEDGEDLFSAVPAYVQFNPLPGKHCHGNPLTTKLQVQSTKGMKVSSDPGKKVATKKKKPQRKTIQCQDVLQHGHLFADVAYCTCVILYPRGDTETPKRCMALQKTEVDKKIKKQASKQTPKTKGKRPRGKSARNLSPSDRDQAYLKEWDKYRGYSWTI